MSHEAKTLYFESFFLGYGKQLYDWIIHNQTHLKEEQLASKIAKICSQMSRLGYPKEWCKIALEKAKIQNSSILDVENATFWLSENETNLTKNHPVSIMDRKFKTFDDVSTIAQDIEEETDDPRLKLLDVFHNFCRKKFCFLSVSLQFTYPYHHLQLVLNHKSSNKLHIRI